MNLTDEVIAQALAWDKIAYLSIGVGGFVVGGMAIILLCFFALPFIIGYFKNGEIIKSFLNIVMMLFTATLFTWISFSIGIANINEYMRYDDIIENKTFGVLKVEIEDKKLEEHNLVLKDFGTIGVSVNTYHSYDRGDLIYIVYIPYKDGKYMFTDWIYSAEEYYREQL